MGTKTNPSTGVDEDTGENHMVSQRTRAFTDDEPGSFCDRIQETSPSLGVIGNEKSVPCSAVFLGMNVPEKMFTQKVCTDSGHKKIIIDLGSFLLVNL